MTVKSEIVIFSFILMTTFFVPSNIFAEKLETRGQLSGWLRYDNGLSDKTNLGLRYMPELDLSYPLKLDKSLDVKLSLKAYSEAPLDDLLKLDDNAHLKTYRAWGRYSSNQFEARLGLQKINFGPARIMRSLKWFDRVDPRDPFELTDGVDALLFRYYFLNNANLWLWGLYGNDDLKGLEQVRSDDDKIEAGGRFQFPLAKSEMALTYHSRKVDGVDWKGKMLTNLDNGRENRFAIDGIWDVEIGLWFEAVATQTRIDSQAERWEEFVTIGGDYTLQSGIHILTEHFIWSTGPKLSNRESLARVTALSADYGIGLLDRINAIVHYDWERDDSYSFVGWQRSYDDWQLNLLAFSKGSGMSGSHSGDGFQFIITYNH